MAKAKIQKYQYQPNFLVDESIFASHLLGGVLAQMPLDSCLPLGLYGGFVAS